MTPRKILAKALARYLGEEAVLAYQQGLKQQGQFIVVTTSPTTPVGQAEVRYRNEDAGQDLVETVSATHEIMYSVEVVRDATADAGTRAEEIRLQLHGNAARTHMLSYGLAFRRIGAVRDITGPVDAAQEPRFQFDAFYTTVQSIEATMLSIESIDINGHYRGEFGSVDDTIELRKP